MVGVALAAIALALPGAGGLTPPALHQHGPRFVDADGRAVALRGFDARPRFPAAYAQVASLGANFVRLPVAWSRVEPTRPVGETHFWNAAELAAIDREVETLARQQVYVLIDFHQWRWSPYFSAGASGMPAWLYAGRYGHSRADVDRAIDDFYTDPNVLARYEAFVRMMVRRYSRYANVIGYEPLNEPPPGSHPPTAETTQLVLSWQGKVAAVIHEVDPTRTVFFQERGGSILGLASTDISLLGPTDRLALDVHDYYSGNATVPLAPDGERWAMASPFRRIEQQPVYAGTLAGQVAFLRIPAARARAWNIPLLVGEWGTRKELPGAGVYQEQMFAAFAACGVDEWARWELGSVSDFAVLAPDFAPNALGAQIGAELRRVTPRRPPALGC